jgi:very-short-patch-repair endonuclease
MKKGKKHSLKSKKRMSKIAKIRLKNPINNPMYGKMHSLKSRKKISLNHANVKGENHPLYGKHHSLKARIKMSLSRKGKNKGKNNPNYKDGETLKKYYCINCGIQISNGCKRCQFCSLKNQQQFDTDIELKVKEELIKRKIKFIHPHRIKNHPADFYLPKHGLILEIDGDYWHNLPGAKEKDKKQSAMMRNKGYYVKRLKGDAILKNRVNYDKILGKYNILNNI